MTTKRLGNREIHPIGIGGLNNALDAGLAGAIGVSNFNIEQLKEAVRISKHPIVANQLLYNVLERGLGSENPRP